MGQMACRLLLLKGNGEDDDEAHDKHSVEYDEDDPKMTSSSTIGVNSIQLHSRHCTLENIEHWCSALNTLLLCPNFQCKILLQRF